VNRLANSTTDQQIQLERRSPSYWRVAFDHPPLNIFGPETIPQLNAIIVALETDPHVKVDYLHFRIRDRLWRSGRMRSSAWHEQFASRPSMASTRRAVRHR
jgi:hypothetical protein